MKPIQKYINLTYMKKPVVQIRADQIAVQTEKGTQFTIVQHMKFPYVLYSTGIVM